MSSPTSQTDATTTVAASSPQERGVVLYDGHCRFCQAQIARLKKWDGGNRLQAISLHDPVVQERWPDISPERLMEEMCVVGTDGGRYWGPEAFRYLSRHLPSLWWLAPLMHIPGSMYLWRPLYRLVARNRYRLFGKAEECEEGTCSLHGR